MTGTNDSLAGGGFHHVAAHDFDADGTPRAKPEGAIIHFALRTGDVDGATERARAAGMQVTTAPKDVNIPSRPGPTPVRLAFFKGPDGEVVELFQNETT